MLYDAKKVQMIRELSDAFGPSGFEDDVAAVLRKWCEPLGRVEEDCLRNVYVYRKENTGNKPVLMLDAHSDEIGFMVHSIKPNGTLRFVMLGRSNTNALSSADVLVRTADGDYIPGIIASKPPHFTTAAEKAAGGNLDISQFVIDIGARSAEEAVNDFHIEIGQPVVPASKFLFDEKHDLMFGKGFDCRIGCASLIETLYRLQGAELPVDVVGVFSAQEEVGERGCTVAVNHVKPDIAIAFEGCPADDTFTEPYAIQTALKKGPMFRFMDVSVICSPRFQRYIMSLAKEKDLPMQVSVREGGGNDAAVINRSCDGIPAVVAGVPVRYIHSMNCITSYYDFLVTAELVEAVARSLTPDIIAGF